MNETIRVSRHGRYAQLLLSLTLLGVLYPLLDIARTSNFGGRLALTVWTVSFWLVLFSIVRACRREGRVYHIISLGFFSLAVLLGFLDLLLNPHGSVPTPSGRLISVLMSIVCLSFFVWTGRTILLDVLSGRRVTTDKIIGAACFYIMIALTFSHVYVLIESLSSDPAFFWFHPELGKSGTLELDDSVYYSFVSLTTLGYGDFVPKNSWARLFSGFEAVLGQLYLTILVARLVGLHLAHAVRLRGEAD